jgi:hypothetical protein
MITRFALFEGHINPNDVEAFRAAITYPNRMAVDIALASPERALAKQATDAILARYFIGKVHHHITDSNDFDAA